MNSRSYVYFPGCSLHATAKEYAISAENVCRVVGMDLQEVKGWNCCGATALPSLDYESFVVLNAGNLKKASRAGGDLVTPCSECFKNLRDTRKTLASRGDVPEVRVRHLFQAMYEDVGIEAIKRAVERPLDGIQVASYYGCLLTRTDPEFDDIERPVKLDQLSEALGATPVPFPFRMKCCGGPIFLPERDTALSMTKSILQNAKDMEADVVQVVCPLCSMMLDIYQDQVEGGSLDIPVLYFTQLIGLALGMTGDDLALDKNIVPTGPLLKRVEAVA
ncbi:MAG: CoB--CoM heterodisulfide reductase iron-sulfur subunit B family protein [Candidatus Thermoplasmatota archaeon]|nr:CoB--CoM heterodisulfide reductase iron-sulfur subunit B family protein [Candidatus Thermoplasmatota archaeon]